MSTATVTRHTKKSKSKRLVASFPIDPYTFTPLRDGVLVRDLPQQPRGDGLIIIRENPEMHDAVTGTTDGTHGDYRRIGVVGEIIACGPGRTSKKNRLIPLSVQPGDRITYTAWNDADDALPAGFRLIQEGDIWFTHEA